MKEVTVYNTDNYKLIDFLKGWADFSNESGSDVYSLKSTKFTHGNGLLYQVELISEEITKEGIEELGFEFMSYIDIMDEDEFKDGYGKVNGDVTSIIIPQENEGTYSIYNQIVYNRDTGNWYPIQLFLGSLNTIQELKTVLKQVGVL